MGKTKYIQVALPFEFAEELNDLITDSDKTAVSKVKRQQFLDGIAQVLIQARKDANLTQDMLNARLGIADRLLNKWECGIKTPSGFNLYCWADALNYELTAVPRDKYVTHLQILQTWRDK